MCFFKTKNHSASLSAFLNVLTNQTDYSEQAWDPASPLPRLWLPEAQLFSEGQDAPTRSCHWKKTLTGKALVAPTLCLSA